MGSRHAIFSIGVFLACLGFLQRPVPRPPALSDISLGGLRPGSALRALPVFFDYRRRRDLFATDQIDGVWFAGQVNHEDKIVCLESSRLDIEGRILHASDWTLARFEQTFGPPDQRQGLGTGRPTLIYRRAGLQVVGSAGGPILLFRLRSRALFDVGAVFGVLEEDPPTSPLLH